jgi:signal recognition particle subunit SRP54
MFSALGENLNKIFDKLKSRGLLSEEDINLAMREIRIALLEADVALPVARQFIAQVKEKALGQEVTKSIKPGQQVVKIVNDELVEILGGKSENKEEDNSEPDDDHKHILNLKGKSTNIIMMVGLQGSGKTTSSAKIALYLRQKLKKKVLLASLDTYRPAAQEQLESLAKQVSIDSLEIIPGQSPQQIATRAVELGKQEMYDAVILDTAGRLQSDEALMQELREIKEISNPSEVLLVADSLTGQQAVNIAKEFHEQVQTTGIVLTRMDGDARGGAALSMKMTTGSSIKFAGVGEKLSELEAFDPERVASRILGMGDVVALVEKAGEVISEQESEKLAEKMKKGQFTMDDLLQQMKKISKMGSVSSLAGMIPGMGKMKEMMGNIDGDAAIRKNIAIISSMTMQERVEPQIINPSRKKRIARGSGTHVADVNRILKQHQQMSKMMKKFSGMGEKDLHKLQGMLKNVR